MKYRMWFPLSILVCIIILTACSVPRPAATVIETPVGIANPASVYCEKQGGKLEMRQDDSGGTFGMCVFSDGSTCEEWAYFRGECPPATPTPEKDSAALEQVKQSALKALSEKLDLPVDQIQVKSLEQVDWSDSCLGLGGPAESCAAVITPGYRVTLEANGRNFEVRTDADGTNARVDETALNDLPAEPQAQPLTQPQAMAIKSLSQQLGIAPSEIKLLTSEETEWPDGCLGLARRDEMCTMAMVPGYRFVLQAQEQQYEVRTDREGRYARVALEDGMLPGLDVPLRDDELLISWRREGGIAGFCDQLMVSPAGEVVAASCAGAHASRVGGFMLSEQQQATLNEWVNSYMSFEYVEKDPAEAADAMSQTLAFTGQGVKMPGLAQQQQIAAFVVSLFTQAAAEK